MLVNAGPWWRYLLSECPLFCRIFLDQDCCRKCVQKKNKKVQPFPSLLDLGLLDLTPVNSTYTAAPLYVRL